METMTVRGELVLNSNNLHRTMHDGSDEDEAVVPAETCLSDNKEKSSDSDSVSVKLRVTASLNFHHQLKEGVAIYKLQLY